ncbi:sugar phosphate nucleotidyltransferase [Flammeovirgaceae bacterium SG7u.111]|nr:sugar phosphate nucleotidyltransferase [Flammeovirgaceae bacterium SG7u.132]WPO37631.1 sugar phosphate nucleotidyltransferase [Flammeovirgaceae bacterium SG7u.111]
MKPTLLILAAGMGSRYGGLKQMDGFGPNDEKIIDYSIYDAIQAGFGKIVFVIRRSFEDAFKEAFVNKLEDKIKIEVVFQELEDLPEGFALPEGREKPWGTGHAILAAAPVINEPFAVINADDFYGAGAYKIISDFLSNLEDTPESESYCMVGYQLGNTLSEHGYVSRGICATDSQDNLQTIVERTQIQRGDDGVIFFKDENEQKHLLDDKDVASMNLMGFPKEAMAQFKKYFIEFLKENGTQLKAEFYLPWVVNMVIQTGHASVKVLNTDAKWFGVTYKEDKQEAVDKIKALVEAKVYPEKLWE